MTFADAGNEYDRRILYQSGKYEGIPLENNTRLVKRTADDGSDYYAVKLHETDIIDIHPGHLVLRMNGWDTRTTRDRLDRYTPGGFRTRRVKGVTYADCAETRVPMDDGLRIDHNAALISDPPPSGIADLRRDVNKDVRGYVRRFVEHIVSDGLQEPSVGDCWFCSMRTKTDADGSISLGDAMGDVSHLWAHIREDYFVPSLFLNAALHFAGAHDRHDREDARMWVSIAVHGDDRMRDMYELQFRTILRRFFRDRNADLVDWCRTEETGVPA
jgi:hypothetical protein